MIKVSFNKDSYKKVERFNNKVTIVTLTGELQLPDGLNYAMPKSLICMMKAQSNPEVIFNYSGRMSIIAKGKTIRSDKDKNNPVLAERIAESKAKLKIYKFIHSFISKYILEYFKLITGYDTPLISNVKNTDDSLYGMADKYMEFITTEENHLADLISQS